MADSDGGQEITRRRITVGDLAALRADAAAVARTAGLSEARAAHFALAVSEAAANTIVHAAGTGEVTLVWDGHQTVRARVTDRGPGFPGDPADRDPQPGATSGRGLWLSRQIIDIVHVDSGPTGTTVHLTMTRTPAPNTNNPGETP